MRRGCQQWHFSGPCPFELLTSGYGHSEPGVTLPFPNFTPVLLGTCPGSFKHWQPPMWGLLGVAGSVPVCRSRTGWLLGAQDLNSFPFGSSPKSLRCDRTEVARSMNIENVLFNSAYIRHPFYDQTYKQGVEGPMAYDFFMMDRDDLSL